jgi:hypothetical protein
MATRTIVNAGGIWSATGTWVEGAVPTAADDVVATPTSGNLTINATANCRSINLAGYTGTFAFTGSQTLNIGTTTPGPGNVALNFPVGMTFTRLSSSVNFISTSATQQTINSNGKQFNQVTINGVGSSYILASDLSTNGTFTITNGAFNDGGYTITLLGAFASNNSNVRSITLSGITIVSVTGSTSWNMFTLTNLTWSHTGTIRAADVGVTVTNQLMRFGQAPNGLAINILEIYTAGSNNVIIEGSCSFNKITTVGGFSETIAFQPGSTQTLTGGEDSLPSGSSGNVLTLKSNTNGVAWNLVKTTGQVVCDYLSLQDSVASGGATFYAGANSTDVSGNSGWSFTSPGGGGGGGGSDPAPIIQGVGIEFGMGL